MNSIYLRRRRKVYVKEGTDSLPDAYVSALQKNIESLGFALSEPLLARLQSLSVDRLASFYKALVKDLREIVGAHREFRPMYPDFPNQVMEMTEARLYLNAIIHYLTNRLPRYERQPRVALIDNPELQLIDLGSKEDCEGIFTQLARSRSSLSPEDKSDINWFVAQYRDDIVRLLPNEMPNKENLAIVGASLLRFTTTANSILDRHIRTATDVLRLAVALSDGDVSLATPTKFVKLRRRDRKRFLGWLERSGDPLEDMLRWKERWKRLGERLHPGDYAELFPKTYDAFRSIRNDLPARTFNSRIEQLLQARNEAGVAKLLASRPGELARRLDHLLRTGGEANPALNTFRSVAGSVATPVLLQVMAHFTSRNAPQELRTFFPKGELAKVYATANQLPTISTEVADETVLICRDALIARFSKLPALGRCYLDPALKNYLVPFSQRSASKALRTLVRGSRLPLPDPNIIRFFLWWKNGSSRTDIDLSAAMFDAAYNYVDVISYYNLKNFGGYHSGDIVDAPSGAAEFIDLDIQRLRAGRAAYIVMSLNSFTEQPYCDLPECFAGWMARKETNSGEIFEPRTVVDRIDLGSNTRICIPAILDLTRREVIWADIALRSSPRWNNVRNNLSGVSLMLRSLTSLRKPDLYTLFSLHIAARGELVPDRQSAERVFSADAGLTPFDVDRISAEFL
jgi:hypothetical protein